MADISPEIAAFQSAKYGEDVRSSMVSLAEKINDEVESATSKVDQNTEDVEGFTLTIGNVTTVAPTDPASATIRGSGFDLILDLEIPRGADGGVAGDISQNAVNFADSATRDNLETGDSLATGFGRIKKWFADLATGAFSVVANALDVVDPGYVLDARQGKTLADAIALKKDASAQADWEEDDPTSGNYIKNKPDLLAYNAYKSVELKYNGSTGSIALWRYGAIVVAHLNITCSAVSSNTILNVTGTIPSGYRPGGTRYFPITPMSSNAPTSQSVWSVTSSGAVQFRCSTTSAMEFKGCAVWTTVNDLPA